MDLNIREAIQVREMTLAQRHLEGQATGEAVETPAGPGM